MAYSPNTIITDPSGVNQAAVKGASTAPTATDKALVVAISPNSPVSVTGTFWQSTQPVSGSVSVSNFPATQPVSGSVSVSNFPASQAVTGTFWQATQPVSLTTLPALATGSNTIGAVIQAGSAGAANAPVYNAYSSTNITTSAYTQLIASSTSATNVVDIFDSSGQAMILATGASGSEVALAYIPPGGATVRIQIPAGTRIAYKALTANATSGYLLMNLYK